MSGFIMDSIGRRNTLILLEIPVIVGWLLIASATNLSMIYCGRLLVGFGSGLVTAPSRVYTGEVTQPHLRGMLGALASVGVSFGVFLEYILGTVFKWNILCAINACVPLLAFLLMLPMPETPGWLLSKNRREEAKKSLSRLRGNSCNIDLELETLAQFTQKNVVAKQSIRDMLRTLVKPYAIKPFILMFFYFLIYQFSGVNPITFYAVDIFQQSGTDINKYTATVILGSVRLVLTLVACVLMRKCGRRVLTVVSGTGCAIAMLGLGTYMYLGELWTMNGEPLKARWIPLACILFYIAVCTIGFLVVPWVMIGEVYPTQVRGIMGGITVCFAHLFVFTVVKTYPYLIKLLNTYGTFWLYGCISLMGTVLLYSYLPETRGRTLQEIEDYFSGRLEKLGSNVSSNEPANCEKKKVPV